MPTILSSKGGGPRTLGEVRLQCLGGRVGRDLLNLVRRCLQSVEGDCKSEGRIDKESLFSWTQRPTKGNGRRMAVTSWSTPLR